MTRTSLQTGIAVAAALAVIVLFFFVTRIPAAPSPSGQEGAPGAAVVVQDLKVGAGPEALPGTTVTVNYVGKLQNGTIFDQSAGRGPFQFILGAGQVIPGWEQGIQGMKVGGERVLVIPPSLAYGAQQMGPIPPNSTLIFDVQLVGVSSSTPSK